MKRIVIILLLIISIIWGYSFIGEGLSIQKLNFTVYGYSDIESQSEDLTLDVAAYNKKNTTEFEEALDELEDAIDDYKDAKEEYESIIETLGTTESSSEAEEIIVASSFPVYEIDFLWATIGGYAKKEGLVITMDVNQNTTVSDTLGYDLYNLSFIVTGEYIDIADFLYDIEDDDQLGFEIRDYSMTAGEATFTIYNVPLNSDTLLEPVIDETLENADGTTDSSESSNTTNTTGSNTVSSNTTNSTNSTNTTNTTNNITNNTTN